MAAFGRTSAGQRVGSGISADTQKLLDSMMKDAGINHKKAQSIKKTLSSTGSLPGSLPSTMSVGKQYSSTSSLGAHRPGAMNPRNADRGRKTKAAIDLQVARDPERDRLPMSRPGMDRDMEKEKKRFAELATEVEENQKFLQEMTAAGKAKAFTAEINGIIAEKTREMREIDSKLSQS